VLDLLLVESLFLLVVSILLPDLLLQLNYHLLLIAPQRVDRPNTA
jgi:hypothetical protein